MWYLRVSSLSDHSQRLRHLQTHAPGLGLLDEDVPIERGVGRRDDSHGVRHPVPAVDGAPPKTVQADMHQLIGGAEHERAVAE